MPETFLDRLKQERDQLQEKHEGLVNFIGTQPFENLSIANRTLLNAQEEAMRLYLDILNVRLELLTK